jgi:hypothetical protein
MSTQNDEAIDIFENKSHEGSEDGPKINENIDTNHVDKP